MTAATCAASAAREAFVKNAGTLRVSGVFVGKRSRSGAQSEADDVVGTLRGAAVRSRLASSPAAASSAIGPCPSKLVRRSEHQRGCGIEQASDGGGRARRESLVARPGQRALPLSTRGNATPARLPHQCRGGAPRLARRRGRRRRAWNGRTPATRRQQPGLPAKPSPPHKFAVAAVGRRRPRRR